MCSYGILNFSVWVWFKSRTTTTSTTTPITMNTFHSQFHRELFVIGRYHSTSNVKRLIIIRVDGVAIPAKLLRKTWYSIVIVRFWFRPKLDIRFQGFPNQIAHRQRFDIIIIVSSVCLCVNQFHWLSGAIVSHRISYRKNQIFMFGNSEWMFYIELPIYRRRICRTEHVRCACASLPFSVSFKWKMSSWRYLVAENALLHNQFVCNFLNDSNQQQSAARKRRRRRRLRCTFSTLDFFFFVFFIFIRLIFEWRKQSCKCNLYLLMSRRLNEREETHTIQKWRRKEIGHRHRRYFVGWLAPIKCDSSVKGLYMQRRRSRRKYTAQQTNRTNETNGSTVTNRMHWTERHRVADGRGWMEGRRGAFMANK